MKRTFCFRQRLRSCAFCGVVSSAFFYCRAPALSLVVGFIVIVIVTTAAVFREQLVVSAPILLIATTVHDIIVVVVVVGVFALVRHVATDQATVADVVGARFDNCRAA